MKKLKLVIYLVYCFEAGVFLTVAPWSRHWGANVFFDLLPGIRDLLLNAYVRGAVSGVGLLHLLLGATDLFNYRYTLEEM